MTAMLLPEKEKLPRIIHVELEKHYDWDDTEYFEPVWGPIFGANYSESIRSSLLPGLPMDYRTQPIHLHGRMGFLSDGSADNACVANLFGAAIAASWRGPLVALKSRPRPGNSGPADPDYVDLGMADAHDVYELIRQYSLAASRLATG